MAVGKKRGTKASAQDNFIGPLDVSGVTTSDVGTGRAWNDGAVSISWTNPSTGNTPTGYKIYDGATLKSTIAHPTNSTTVGGYSAGSSVTLTVKSYDDYATASGVSGSAVTITTVPDAPSSVTASSPTPSSAANTAGSTTDSISWSAPSTGGKSITNYHWESNDSKSGDAGTSTSVSGISQEGGTSQSYRVYATNANGNSAWSSYSGSVTTFSFTPFSFVPFGAFGFTPFGAFGFTPFGAFGFTPFGAFGFTPFGAFGFTPFSFAPEFNFSPPSCIEANTLIATPNGDVKACDLRLGDTIYSYKFIEIPESGSSGYEDFDYVNYMTPNLTATEKVETTIVDIIPSSKNVVICFNEDTTRLYSTSQPMFVKRLSLFEILPAGVIEEGDSLIEIGDDLSVNEIFITSINYISGDHSVYQFSCEPQDWFIAGKYLVHNK